MTPRIFAQGTALFFAVGALSCALLGLFKVLSCDVWFPLSGIGMIIWAILMLLSLFLPNE